MQRKAVLWQMRQGYYTLMVAATRYHCQTLVCIQAVAPRAARAAARRQAVCLVQELQNTWQAVALLGVEQLMGSDKGVKLL